MAHTMTHTTNKNEAKEVTGYVIKADGTEVGTASKDKGKFNFTPAWPEGKSIEGAKTMRDLKTEVEKAIPANFVKENAPKKEEKTKTPTKTTEEQETAEREAIEAAADGESEDIDLD